MILKVSQCREHDSLINSLQCKLFDRITRIKCMNRAVYWHWVCELANSSSRATVAIRFLECFEEKEKMKTCFDSNYFFQLSFSRTVAGGGKIHQSHLMSFSFLSSIITLWSFMVETTTTFNSVNLDLNHCPCGHYLTLNWTYLIKVSHGRRRWRNYIVDKKE